MDTKLFELRDAHTFIPIIATLMSSGDARERWLLGRAGYSPMRVLVLLTRLDGHAHAQYDPYDWGDRTFSVAHDHIARHWDELKSGDLVDVRHILGERDAPCETEQAILRA